MSGKPDSYILVFSKDIGGEDVVRMRLFREAEDMHDYAKDILLDGYEVLFAGEFTSEYRYIPREKIISYEAVLK